MRRLTGLDAAFLYLETPASPMHVGGVYVLETGHAADQLYARLRKLICERLHLMAPLRWRLVEVPMGLHHPLWINDPDFDLDLHLHRGTAAADGDTEADPLAAYVAAMMAVPLDRRRPLWELHVVDGLPDGRLAVVTKVHHALIDGHSGAELTATLMDVSAEPRTVDPPADAWKPDAVPTTAETLAYGLASLAQQPAQLLAGLSGAMSAAAGRDRSRQTPPLQVPRTAFNGPITANRRYAYGDLAMADVMGVRQRSGATVNDVLLTVSGGALRRVLLERGELPVDPVVAMVPVPGPPGGC